MGTYKTDWQLTETVMPEDMNRIEGNIKGNNKSFNDFKSQYDNNTAETNKKIDRKADKVDVILKEPIRLDKKDLNTITEPGRYVCVNCTNAPTTYGRMDILVWNEHKTAKWVTQIFYSDVNNKVYTRCSTNSEGTEYTPWAMMYSTTNKPNWGDIQNKPSTYTPSIHNHNDLYYTKSEVDTKDISILNSAKSFVNGELTKKLNLTGDTMTGNLEIVKTDPVFRLLSPGGVFRAVVNSVNNTVYLQAGSDESDSGKLRITGNNAKNLSAIDILVNGNENARINNNTIYHAGNKPTPDDIGAAANNHNHDDRYLNKNAKAESAKNADAVPWNGIANKPTTYPPSNHNHDDRYLKTSDIQFVNGELKAGDKTLVTTDPKVFWDAKSGGWVFDSGKVISLPKKISDMANGLMLLWSTRSGGTIHNYNYHWSYITKEHLKVGGGDIFLVVPYDDDRVCTKRVGITETTIRGNDKNMNGNSTHVVLRKVVEW